MNADAPLDYIYYECVIEMALNFCTTNLLLIGKEEREREQERDRIENLKSS